MFIPTYLVVFEILEYLVLFVHNRQSIDGYGETSKLQLLCTPNVAVSS